LEAYPEHFPKLSTKISTEAGSKGTLRAKPLGQPFITIFQQRKAPASMEARRGSVFTGNQVY
jgi:hypothetical protein